MQCSLSCKGHGLQGSSYAHIGVDFTTQVHTVLFTETVPMGNAKLQTICRFCKGFSYAAVIAVHCRLLCTANMLVCSASRIELLS